MKYYYPNHQGMALLSTIALTMLVASFAAIFLRNATQVIGIATTERDRIQVNHLEDAAVHHCVIAMITPRDEVVVNALPVSRFIYQDGEFPVRVSVSNESAKLNPINIAPNILEEILHNLGYSDRVSLALKEFRLKSKSNVDKPKEYSIGSLFRGSDIEEREIARFKKHFSFYNASSSVNVNLAEEDLLRALPDLDSVDVNKILEERLKHNLVSTAISHPLISNRASDHYIIHTEVVTPSGVTKSSRIIKISLQSFPPFKLIEKG